MAETREIAEIKDKSTGDVNELRDKKVATATDASSAADVTSNLKFLLLNGTNGEFETALKSYVDEAVRQALGTLVSGIDKGTGASKILATDSSNDLGTITPANLANVLGVVLTFSSTKIITTYEPGTVWGGYSSIGMKIEMGDGAGVEFAMKVAAGTSDFAIRCMYSNNWYSWKYF